MSTNPTMSSTDKVMRTPELLELILFELPLRTLLTRASLVSKQWRNHITSSLPLQRALFFKTCPPGTPCRINPLLAADFPIFFDGVDHYMKSFHQLTFGVRVQDNKNTNGHSDVADDGKAPPAAPEHLVLRAAFLRPSASWRRMLPRQPAVDELAFWHYKEFRSELLVGDLSISCQGNMSFPSYGRVTFHDEPAGLGFGPEGWTMGALYDLAILVTRHERRRFRVFWDAQAYMRREAEMLAKAAERGRVIAPDSDVRIAEAKVHVHGWDRQASEEEMSKEKVLEKDMSDDETPEEDMPDVMDLADGLGGREVVFQSMVHLTRQCLMGHGPAGQNNKAKERTFMQYYSFPAADLDAE